MTIRVNMHTLLPRLRERACVLPLSHPSTADITDPPLHFAQAHTAVAAFQPSLQSSVPSVLPPELISPGGGSRSVDSSTSGIASRS